MNATSITHAITTGDSNLSIDQSGGTNLPGEDGSATVSVTLDSGVAPGTYGPYTITSTGTGKDNSTQTATFEFTATVNAAVTSGPGEIAIPSLNQIANPESGLTTADASRALYSDSALSDIPDAIDVTMDYYDDTEYQALKSAINTWSNPANASDTTSVDSEKTVARYIDGWASGHVPNVSKAVYTPKVTLKSVGTTTVNHVLWDTAKLQYLQASGSSANTQLFNDLELTLAGSGGAAVSWTDSAYQSVPNGFTDEFGYTNIIDSNGKATGIQFVKSTADLDVIVCENAADIGNTANLDAFTGLQSNSFVVLIEPEHILCWDATQARGGDNNYGFASNFTTLGQSVGSPVTRAGGSGGGNTFKPVP
jgi:hypothetical protein